MCFYFKNIYFDDLFLNRRTLRCCYISALVLTCFRLTKDPAIFFRPETIVASFLRLMVLFFKVIFNHKSVLNTIFVLMFLETVHWRMYKWGAVVVWLKDFSKTILNHRQSKKINLLHSACISHYFNFSFCKIIIITII